MSALSRIQLACNVDDLASVAVSLGGAMVYVATAGGSVLGGRTGSTSTQSGD